jgi:hypothetical protein
MGCGDDDNATSTALGKADPGGTWGAEVNVTVTGLGRVTSAATGIDCPTGSCFSKFIFDSNSADGANGGAVLQATPTLGAQFLGWSFEAVTLPASGRGPDNCNPLQRAASVPSGNMTASTITLPYGEIDGKPPTGQELACAPYTKVPLAYKVTAAFSTTATITDGGVESGVDAGGPTVIYQGTVGDIAAKDLGFVGANMFWHSGTTTIDVGYSPNSSPPQFATKLTNPASAIQLWQITPNGIVFTDNSNNVYSVSSGSVTNVGSSGINSCSAVWEDSFQNIYCRTFSTIIVFKSQGFSWDPPITLYTGVASGNSIVVESSGGPIYYGTTNAIVSVPVAGNDAGLPTTTTIVNGAFSPSRLTPSPSGFAWTEGSNGGFMTTSKAAGAFKNTISAVQGLVTSITYDSSTETYVFTSNEGIYLVTAFSPSGSLFKSGFNFASAAANSSYVFWTQTSDPNVYRANRNGL